MNCLNFDFRFHKETKVGKMDQNMTYFCPVRDNITPVSPLYLPIDFPCGKNLNSFFKIIVFLEYS